MTHLDSIAALSYADGEDPIDHAVWRLAQVIEIAADVATARQIDPATFPVYVAGTDPETTARRAVGLLLALGWTPPAQEGDPTP